MIYFFDTLNFDLFLSLKDISYRQYRGESWFFFKSNLTNSVLWLEFLDHLHLLNDTGFPGGSDGKESACNVGDPGSIPGEDDPLEKGMVTHSSILAWRIPWTEEPGGLQSRGVTELGTTEQLTLSLSMVQLDFNLSHCHWFSICFLLLLSHLLLDYLNIILWFYFICFLVY